MSHSVIGAIVGIALAVWAGPLVIAMRAEHRGDESGLRRTVVVVVLTLVLGGLSVGWLTSAANRPPKHTFVCPPEPAPCPWQAPSTDL